MIYYVDIHQRTITPMTVDAFCRDFNAEKLDDSRCYAYTDKVEAEATLKEAIEGE